MMTSTLHLALGTAGVVLGLLCAGCGGGEASPPLVAEETALDEAQLGEVEMGMNDVAPAEPAAGNSTANTTADSNEVDAQGPENPAEEPGEGAGSNVTATIDARTLQIGAQQAPAPIDPHRFRSQQGYWTAPMPTISMPPGYRPPTQARPYGQRFGRGR